MNLLFVMCDQLRWDYLGCYGHPHLATPNIDRLAATGVRFDRAYVQSPICGPSRMSFYTGRYVDSHGSSWNGFPLKVGETTLGDHLRPLGVRVALAGKTHMRADREGMARLGVAPWSLIGARLAECGFEAFERDDGLHPDGAYAPDPAYDAYLRGCGWIDPNPWQNVANSAEGADGELLSGWFLEHSDRAARVAEADSETPYMTRRAIEFIDTAGASPWLLHLSYVKPHWPCIAPAPYHAMYGPETHLPPIRDEGERRDPHPIYRAFMEERVSKAFCRPEVRRAVLQGYMGLIKQIDDQIGVLLAALDARDLLETTMIVFTSDHGDYLGDHWLGEKELFHEPSVRIPLIILDPRPAADPTRGTASKALVEAIDLAPSFIEVFGGEPRPHILEGHSLVPLMHGGPAPPRACVISEYDCSMRLAREAVGRHPRDCRLFMVFDGRFKAMFAPGLRPMLLDLGDDPNEFVDLGANPGQAATLARLKELLLAWALRTNQRTTISDAEILRQAGPEAEAEAGILIGYASARDLDGS